MTVERTFGVSAEENANPENKAIHSDQFVEFLTGCQGRVYTYIRTLVPDANGVKDVLQQANLVVWRKTHEFDEGRNPYAWLCRIAYYETLAY